MKCKVTLKPDQNTVLVQIKNFLFLEQILHIFTYVLAVNEHVL